jgi:hypothetical protein
MRVRLRPGTHLAPVQQGAYLSRAGKSFIIQGPPALYALLDSQLGRLVSGTTVDELVTAVGTEAVRPVLDNVLRTLLDRDVLLDIDTCAGPEPPPDDARRYADVLAYLEARCADPYAAFARLRTATVLLRGDAGTRDTLIRSLDACGLRVATPESEQEPALAVVVTPLSRWPGWPADVPPGVAVLPVIMLPAGALIGPVCTSRAEFAAVAAAAERIVAWQQADPALAAPATMTAVLAGSLAGRSAFEFLAEAGPRDWTASVVYGRRLEARRFALPALPAAQGSGEPAPRWASVDAAASNDDEPALPLAKQAQERGGTLTDRWTGIASWHRDLDLPQLPMSTATLDSRVGAPAGRVLGWADNRSGAMVNAMLAFLRARCAAIAPEFAATAPEPAPGTTALAAAGLTSGRFLLDGLLRLAGLEAVAGVVPDKVDWADLPQRHVTALWSLLRDYFDVPAHLWLRAVPGLSWPLASVVADGTVLATQWGPTQVTAAQAALSAAAARAQLGPELAALLPDEPTGTWALESVSAEAVAACHRQFGGWLSARSRMVRASRLLADQAAGEIALPCGLVWLS